LKGHISDEGHHALRSGRRQGREPAPSDDLEAHRPIIRIFCGLRVRSPGASNAPELPASDTETLSGWRDLISRPFDPQTSAACPRTSPDVQLIVAFRWTNPNGGQNGGQAHSQTKRKLAQGRAVLARRARESGNIGHPVLRKSHHPYRLKTQRSPVRIHLGRHESITQSRRHGWGDG
jgi:hypothetical protein